MNFIFYPINYYFFHFVFQYLKLARTLEGYGELTFPHCACDARKEGHVMVIVGLEALKMQACKEDGTIEVFKFNSDLKLYITIII